MEEEKIEALRPAFPLGRVKKIMKLDQDIKKVNSEALLLISLSTDLFLRFLAEKSAEIAVEKKRKTVNLEYLRIAACKHPSMNDFIVDSLPKPSKPSIRSSAAQIRSDVSVEDPLPTGTRRIDDFFSKSDSANS